jgi:hypothetical protein
MTLTIPELSFVVLIGVSGSGESIPRLRDAKTFQADGEPGILNPVQRGLQGVGFARRSPPLLKDFLSHLDLT